MSESGISGSSSGIIQTMVTGRLRRRIALVLVLFAVLSITIPAARHSILQNMGRALVVDERVKSADIIVVSGEADGAGVLEASDLVRSGVAKRVAIFSYARTTVEQEFTRRGIPYRDKTGRYLDELNALGVVNVEQIPTYVAGTGDEGPALARWCDEQQIHSVVLVGSREHSRRLRRVLHRSMQGHAVTMAVCGSRFSEFDPDFWWTSRWGVRAEIIESEKLLLDIIRHPIS